MKESERKDLIIAAHSIAMQVKHEWKQGYVTEGEMKAVYQAMRKMQLHINIAAGTQPHQPSMP